MSYDHELILFSHEVVEDDVGNQTVVEGVPRAILCDIKSIGRNEFYNAASAGLNPEIVFVINKYEYANEDKVSYEGLTYRVIKTYSTGLEEIELTCERGSS